MVIFEFSVSKHQTRNFVQRIFGEKQYYKFFIEAFNVSKKICKIDNEQINDSTFIKRPYVYISLDLKQNHCDLLMKMRVDIFKRNLTFKIGC